MRLHHLEKPGIQLYFKLNFPSHPMKQALFDHKPCPHSLPVQLRLTLSSTLFSLAPIVLFPRSLLFSVEQETFSD